MRALFSLLLFAIHGLAYATTLVPGVQTPFTLSPESYTTDFRFEVPAGTTKFRVELDSTTPGVDLDLFLRAGNPFAGVNAYGLPFDFDGLAEQAQYYAIGSTAQEFIAVGASNYRPAQAGTWHLAVLNFANQPVNASLRVIYSDAEPSPLTFDVRFDLPASNCDVAPWNDTTPAQPVGGNPGTTRGQQRRNALLESLRQLTADLDSEVPITVRACWDNLEVSASGATTLAGAAPTNFFIDDRSLVFSGGQTDLPRPALPEKYTLFAAAPTARLSGTSACRVAGGSCANVTDIFIVYNKRVGDADVLNGVPFYFGYDRPPSGGGLDFVAISVHELGHGLGFVSLVRNTATSAGPIGSKPLGRDDAYSRRISAVSGGEVRPYSRITDAERAAAMASGTGLQWTDSRAVDSPINPPTSNPGILLHAPSTIEPGSTGSHLHRNLLGQLMTPQLQLGQGARQLGLAVPMLHAVGWDPAARSFPLPAAPFSGLWFERDRDGHGIDFQRVFTNAAGFDVYSLIFYSYDSSGRPEWYIGVGALVDGVFVADNNASERSLVRYRYGGPSNPQQPLAAVSGQIRIDFNQAGDSPACNDGTERPQDTPLGVMRWTLGSTSDAWCIEELVPAAARPESDLTGTWYAGDSDSGWGASVTTAALGGGQRLLFSTLYYPDAGGNGRWAFVSSADYQPGQALPVFERSGYCRTCPASLVDTQIGTLTVTLSEAVQGVAGGNRLSFDITYGGPEGGRFSRDNIPFVLLTAPPQ